MKVSSCLLVMFLTLIVTANGRKDHRASRSIGNIPVGNESEDEETDDGKMMNNLQAKGNVVIPNQGNIVFIYKNIMDGNNREPNKSYPNGLPNIFETFLQHLYKASQGQSETELQIDSLEKDVGKDVDDKDDDGKDNYIKNIYKTDEHWNRDKKIFGKPFVRHTLNDLPTYDIKKIFMTQDDLYDIINSR